MGVVVWRYIDILIIITYFYSTCFLQQLPTSLFIFKMFLNMNIEGNVLKG